MPISDSGYQSILNITNLAIIAILIGLIIFIVKIISVFGIFIFSFLIAFLLYPMVDWLSDRRIPRIWAILIVYVFLGALILAVSAAVIPYVTSQAYILAQQLPTFAQDMQEQMTPFIENLQKYLHDKGISPEAMQSYVNQTIPTIQQWAVNIGNRLLIGLQGAVGGIVALFSVPIIVFYLLLDASKIRKSLMGLVPKRTASEVQFLLNRLSDMLNHYIRGQLRLSFIIFTFCTTGLLLLGVPHALLLGIVAGMTEVVPIIGPILAFLPACIISLFVPWDYGIGGFLSLQGVTIMDIGWVRGLIVALFYMVMQWCENNLIVPRVMGKNLNLHPLTVMFSLLAGGFLAGIFGMLLALPIAACLKVVFEIYYAPFIERVEELVRHRPAQQATVPGEPSQSPGPSM